MNDGVEEFQRLVGAVVRRWWGQNKLSPGPEAELDDFAGALWEVVNERGLPRPLAVNESGAPGSMPEPEIAPLVARAVGRRSAAHFNEPAKQLVKTCLYPEFRVCRDSFREVGADGICRRQQLERVRSRLSGAHCVDCPHWVALTPAQHERYLTAEWCGDPAQFLAHRALFLPEDFRALRVWLHEWTRRRI
jgi:hypothetical protein